MNVLTVTGRLIADPSRPEATRPMRCEFRVVVDGLRGMWLPVVCWGPLAGSCYRRLRAGHHVALSGPLQVDDYVSRAGVRQRRWYLKAEHATFLDHKPATNVDGAADAARGECR
jgi:single-stranded DNA-binding protein